MKRERLDLVADWCGWGIDDAQADLLLMYQDWLAAEAIPAGGLGPEELSRLEQRHIGDSLLFSAPLDQVPNEIWDLGSGVGLPGIPLSILFPETKVTLVDRSEKRCDLAERAVRVLGLPNVEVQQDDIEQLSGQMEVIVSRATLSPEHLGEMVFPRLSPDGLAIVGGSWEREPDVTNWEVLQVPPMVLDHTVWILIMRSR